MPTFDELKAAAVAEWQALERGDKPHIFVGTDTSGRAAGAVEVLDAVKKTLARLKLDAVVHETGGYGLCYAEPIMDIVKAGAPRISYNNLTPELAARIVEEYLVRDNPHPESALAAHADQPFRGIRPMKDLDTWKCQVRIAMRNCGVIDVSNINHYIARGGYAGLNRALTQMTPAQVLDEVKKSDLRGRGGAAFRTAQKWSFLSGGNAPIKYHACNAEEGDPGAFNDKTLLESDPHTVLEGLAIAGYATGARIGYVFIRCTHKEVVRRVDVAIEQAKKLGLLGENILGAKFSFDIEVAETGESYVAGEETALMEAIEGKRSMPRFRPPFPAQAGLWQRPTNVNNVKTYSYVPPILEKGGDWYASIGTKGSKGTALVCLTGHVKRQGLYEVPFGMTLRQVIDGPGGGVPSGRPVKLLQTGGPLGGFLGASELDLPIDFDVMAQAGAILGSGGIIVADDTTPALKVAQLLYDFIQEESCGKCFPCRVGTHHLLMILEHILEGKAQPSDIDTMMALGNTLTASLCGHGQLAVNPIKSAMKYFGKEIEAYVKTAKAASVGAH